MKGWYYFGCESGAGHRVVEERGRSLPYEFRRTLECFDGKLCFPEAEGLYIAALSRLGGLGLSALAFWDRTVDRRPGSNSVFFAPDLTITAEALLEGGRLKFPRIFARFPAIDLSRAGQ